MEVAVSDSKTLIFMMRSIVSSISFSGPCLDSSIDVKRYQNELRAWYVLMFGIHDEIISCKNHCTFQNRESKIFPFPLLKWFQIFLIFTKCPSWISLTFSLLSVFPILPLLFLRLKKQKIYIVFFCWNFQLLYLFNVMNSCIDYVYKHIYRQKIVFVMFHADSLRKENEKIN